MRTTLRNILFAYNRIQSYAFFVVSFGVVVCSLLMVSCGPETNVTDTNGMVYITVLQWSDQTSQPGRV